MASSIQTLAFPLTNRKSRPFFMYNNGNVDISFLFDTGAHTPVWCAGEELLVKAYPEAKEINLEIKISGFGKEPEKGNIFLIPCFELKDGRYKYTINNLYVAAILNPSIGCQFVLSMTMFSKTDCTIINRNNKMLRLESDKEEFICTPLLNGEELTGVTVWTQKS